MLAGCQSVTGNTAGQNANDAGITASVKTQLIADKVSNLAGVDVDTTQGTVVLNGSVETMAQKARAQQIAQQVEGVKGVVNNLQVR